MSRFREEVRLSSPYSDNGRDEVTAWVDPGGHIAMLTLSAQGATLDASIHLTAAGMAAVREQVGRALLAMPDPVRDYSGARGDFRLHERWHTACHEFELPAGLVADDVRPLEEARLLRVLLERAWPQVDVQGTINYFGLAGDDTDAVRAMSAALDALCERAGFERPSPSYGGRLGPVRA